MAWELLAIGAIVFTTVSWFVMDERRLREERLMARVRHFAEAPAYRHQPSAAARLARLG